MFYYWFSLETEDESLTAPNNLSHDNATENRDECNSENNVKRSSTTESNKDQKDQKDPSMDKITEDSRTESSDYLRSLAVVAGEQQRNEVQRPGFKRVRTMVTSTLGKLISK